ncbi:MAG: class I SAM-dependent methyltransferase [Deltaproteobacteria bacterium]|nr:class I SAM-dependent methyltransferase [Deltaproteobacteria bacterium]
MNKDSKDTLQDINAEILFYENNPHYKKGHFLMKYPFVCKKRDVSAFARRNQTTRAIIKKYIEKKFGRSDGVFKRILDAPCGPDADQEILCGLSREYHGMDISEKAVALCPSHIQTRVGDILHTGYPDGYFDMVSSFNFFHHVHKVGFKPFLDEFNRILDNNGVLLIVEPSLFYPLSWLMLLGRRVFGNISGLVPDERPINPFIMKKVVASAGFRLVTLRALTFAHNRLPVPLQYLVDLVMMPLSRVLPVGFLGWFAIYICEKKG